MTHDAPLSDLKQLDYQFYSKLKYFAELRRLIDKTSAGSRILLMTMTIDTDVPEVAYLLADLETAAARGVQVTLAVDAYSFMMDDGRMGPLWYGHDLSAPAQAVFKRKKAAIDRLDGYPSAQVVIINKQAQRFSLPVAGRSHIKTAIIDNTVFIGGCNMDKPEYVDLMVSWHDIESSDELYDRMSQITDVGNAREALADTDQQLTLDSRTDLLIDAGVRNQSLILHGALDLIDSATEWLTVTCQFFPNSITAQHLLRARKRGVTVDIIYSHPRHHGIIGGTGQQLSILMERSRLPADMFQHCLGARGPMIHAKIIACDQGLMIGSHNYVRAGVRLGTAECALIHHDNALALEAQNLIHGDISTVSLKP